MSRGYWIATFALGLIVVAASAAGALLTWSHVQENSRARADAADTYAHYSSANEICGSAVSIAERTSCLEERINSYEQREHTQADLRAQQDMSAWTLSMVWIGLVGTILSAVAIWLIFETLRETRAVGTLTRRVGNAQTRGYLTISEGRLISGSNFVGLQWKCENYGQSPANIESIHGWISTRHKHIFGTITSVPDDVCHISVLNYDRSISPNSHAMLHLRWDTGIVGEKDITLKEIVADLSAGNRVFGLVKIVYYDVFGVKNTVTGDVASLNDWSEFAKWEANSQFRAAVAIRQKRYENDEN